MNNIDIKRISPSSAGTTMLIGLGIALTPAAPPVWPEAEPETYILNHVSSTYSEKKAYFLSYVSSDVDQELTRNISELYKVLSDDQERLGSDFERVWDENIDNLYET